MLSRLLISLPSSAPKRTYSFFSSKHGSGRSFNAPKPPKVAVGKAADTPHQAAAIVPPQTADEASQLPSPPPEPKALSAASELELSLDSSYLTSSPAFGPLPMSHPKPTLPNLHLHHFFSIDRPLLLLSQPVNALFESAPQPTMEPTPVQVPGEDGLTFSHDDPEGDINAARLLARSLVIHRVGSVIDWSDTLKKLGAESDLVVNMDSVKRKRRKKMNKHR